MNDILKKEVLYHIQRLAALSSQIQASKDGSPFDVMRDAPKFEHKGWMEGMGLALEIVRKYEPEEKSEGISYASNEIQKAMNDRVPF